MNVRRNDGQGVEVEIRMYGVPTGIAFEAIQVSAINRQRALYKIGGAVTDWPKSRFNLDIVSEAGQTCGNGSLGYTKEGNVIRSFGDIHCEKTMDVQTIRR